MPDLPTINLTEDTTALILCLAHEDPIRIPVTYAGIKQLHSLITRHGKLSVARTVIHTGRDTPAIDRKMAKAIIGQYINNGSKITKLPPGPGLTSSPNLSTAKEQKLFDEVGLDDATIAAMEITL